MEGNTTIKRPSICESEGERALGAVSLLGGGDHGGSNVCGGVKVGGMGGINEEGGAKGKG
jgi:hypothetical protein